MAISVAMTNLNKEMLCIQKSGHTIMNVTVSPHKCYPSKNSANFESAKNVWFFTIEFRLLVIYPKVEACNKIL